MKNKIKWEDQSKNFLKINGQSKEIIVPDSSSLWGMKEISQENQMYDINNFDKDIKLFFDIGSNIGLSSIWASTNFNNPKIIAVEPSKELKDFYLKNTSFLKSEIKYIDKAAATNSDGYLNFYFSETHNGSSTTTESLVNKNKHNDSYEVEKVDIFDLILKETENFDKESVMLKMDIEGGEIPILNDPRIHEIIKKRVGTILIELHEDLDMQIKIAKKLIMIFGDSNVSFEIQTSFLEKEKGYSNYISHLGQESKLNNYIDSIKNMVGKKLIAILTIHNQSDEILEKYSIKSLKAQEKYLDEIIIVSSIKSKKLDWFNTLDKWNVIYTKKSSKLKKLNIANKFLSDKYNNNNNNNNNNNFIIVLDADDEVINLKEIRKNIFFNWRKSSDMFLAPHIYKHYENEEVLRTYGPNIEDWSVRELFPYYGNHSIIIEYNIFSESLNDISNVNFQRGEDGFRMVQYFSKAENISTIDIPFIKFNRLDGVDHTSLHNIKKTDIDWVKKLNIKFDEFTKLLNLNKINLWHLSQIKWIKLEYKKYGDVLNKKIRKQFLNSLKKYFDNSKLFIILTIYDPSFDELEYWSTLNLGKRLWILNDNPKLDQKKIDFIKEKFSSSSFITFDKNYKRYNLVRKLCEQLPNYININFKIVDPDDFLLYDRLKKIDKCLIELGNKRKLLTIHKGTKIYGDKKNLLSKTSNELIKLSEKTKFPLVFATFQTIHSSSFLSEVFSKIPNNLENIQFHDDTLLSFLYLTYSKKVNFINEYIYIQFHRNGQTSNSNRENEKTLIRIYDYCLENNLKITYNNSQYLWKIYDINKFDKKNVIKDIWKHYKLDKLDY